MDTCTLKSTILFGYVDISAAGCRTLLGADTSNYISHPWHLKILENDKRTKTASIVDVNGTVLPASQIYNHKEIDVSILIITVAIPDDISHSVANEVLDTVANVRNLKELSILSAFPTGIQSCVHLFNKSVATDASYKLKCADAFLNSLIQFLMVDHLPFSVLITDGRKIKKETCPNTVDGSQQCIEVLSNAVNKELDLECQIGISLTMKYTGAAYKDDTINSMFL